MSTSFGDLPVSLPSSPSEGVKALSLGLAVQAFKLIGRDDFRVTADLDAGRPWTVEAFEAFQRVLLMAYNRGAKDMAAVSSRGGVMPASQSPVCELPSITGAHERPASVLASRPFDVLAWTAACDGFALSARRHAGELDAEANGLYYSMAVDAALSGIPAEHHRIAVLTAMNRGAYRTLRNGAIR
jgi:hypothetical protein